MWSLRGVLFLVVAGPFLAASSGTFPRPDKLECVRTSSGACDEENVCITNVLSDRFTIVFDFGRQRFQSTWGRGRITQSWDLPDGTHGVLVSAPPASGEMIFSADYRSGGQRKGGSVTGYTCNPRGGRGR